MLRGCLEGFLYSIPVLALIILFGGGTIDLDELFGCALVAIIIFGFLKWLFKK